MPFIYDSMATSTTTSLINHTGETRHTWIVKQNTGTGYLRVVTAGGCIVESNANAGAVNVLAVATTCLVSPEYRIRITQASKLESTSSSRAWYIFGRYESLPNAGYAYYRYPDGITGNDQFLLKRELSTNTEIIYLFSGG